MAPRAKAKKTEEELRIKREKERERYRKIRGNPAKLEEERLKSKQKYLKRLEKKQVKPIKELTPRQQRAKRKVWKASSNKHRKVKKEAVQCYCTVSESLLHNAPAIWAHIQPILDDLAKIIPDISIIHFLSDSPATQYRNKTMFFFMAKKLEEFYSKLTNFTWNYSEAGHGKGAPDGIGGLCKRTADRLVAEGNDIMDFKTLYEALVHNCPGVRFFQIKSVDIIAMEKKINPELLLVFKGTMKVHQVLGTAFSSRLIFRKLSTFEGQAELANFEIGSQQYGELLEFDDIVLPSTSKNTPKIKYSDVYSSDDDENNIKPGDFILVEFIGRHRTQTQYRYVAICQDIEPDGDIKIMSLKSTSTDGTTFRAIENDVSFVSGKQIIEVLPTPKIVVRGNREFYSFSRKIPIHEMS